MSTLDIYLDMDGVCTDFVSAAIRAHGFDVDDTLRKWQQQHAGEFFPYKIMGMEKDRFWKHLNTQGESFWTQLAPYPWYDELMERASVLGHVVFLTSPTHDPCCASGKLHWLQARFGVAFQDYIFTAHKDRLAHPRAVLLDDFDHNVQKFVARGGHGIVFPQIWNSSAPHVGQRMEYVFGKLNAWA